MKNKEQYFLDLQSSTQKLATMQDSQALQNTDEKQYCHLSVLDATFGCHQLVTRLPANRESLLKLYTPMLGKSP